MPILILLILLSGCSMLTSSNINIIPVEHPIIEEFKIKGKIGIITKDDFNNFSLDWEQQGDRFNVMLNSALDLYKIEVFGDENTLTLNVPDKKLPIKSREEAANELGFSLPINSMRYWLIAMKNPELPGTVERGSMGFKRVIKQGDWQIDYDEYASFRGITLPKKIRLQHEVVTLKLSIRDWDTSLHDNQ